MALSLHELREKQRKEYSGEHHMTREKEILGLWLLLQHLVLADLIRYLTSAPKWTPYLTDLESVVGWDVINADSCFGTCGLTSKVKTVLPFWMTEFEVQHFRQAWKEFHYGGEDVNCGAKSLHILYLLKNVFTCIDILLIKQVLEGLGFFFFLPTL